ncbi:MAG: hypothetical protein J6T10_09560 [Methanobrevibacter sp.]|nr:hypothetical protein [Methanobrevibacter sp.]
MSLIQNYEYIRDWVNNRFLQELQSYYNKSYIDDAIQDLIQRITDAIAGVTQFDYVICESTYPVTGKKGTIYFVPSGSGENVYDEYLYIDDK